MKATRGVGNELKALGTLGVPIILTQLSQMGIGVIDSIMAGRVSPVDLAGVALGAHLYIPAVVFLAGIAIAVTPMVSQMHGAGQEAGAGPVVRQALWIAVCGGVLAMGIMQYGEAGYRLIGVDEAAIPVATAYLTYMSFGLVPTLAFFVLRYLCEGLSMDHAVDGGGVERSGTQGATQLRLRVRRVRSSRNGAAPAAASPVPSSCGTSSSSW